MEVTCKEICPCCESCKGCLGFQKILDLKNVGLVIYRHTNRINEINKATRVIESSVDTVDDVFIIHNTKNTEITADECITEIDQDQDISCARCRELIQRTKRYLQNILPIEKKDVISVCDHCQQNKIKRKSPNYCYKCHEILKKYNSDKVKQHSFKEDMKKWLSSIQQILVNISSDKRKKIKLKRRSYSELYLNNISKKSRMILPHLQVEPMYQKAIRISESLLSMDNLTGKSENDLNKNDSGFIKLKSVLLRGETLIGTERHDSLSLTTHETSLGKVAERNEDERMSMKSQFIKGILQRHTDYSHQLKMKHSASPDTLRKYYSEEDLFFSTACENDEIKNFSYVFPKEITDEIRPLNRIKTSAELILDAQKLLQKRVDDERVKLSNKNTMSDVKKYKDYNVKESKKLIETLHKDKNEESQKDKEETQIQKQKKVQKEDNVKEKQEQTQKEKETKPKKELQTTKEDKTKYKDKKGMKSDDTQKMEDKNNIENLKKVINEHDKQKSDLSKSKKPQVPDKVKLQSDKKEMGTFTQKMEDKSNMENLKKVMNEHDKRKSDLSKSKKPQVSDKVKFQSDKKEMETEQKPKPKIDKETDNEKNKDKQPDRLQKAEDDSYIANLKNMLDQQNKQKAELSKIKKQQDEDYNKTKTEADKKANEKEKTVKTPKESNLGKQTEQKKPKDDKKQDEQDIDLNIKNIKIRKASADDLILQLVKLKKINKGNEQRGSKPATSPMIIRKHNTHRGVTQMNCLLCDDSELEIEIDNILNEEPAAEKTEIIVGNKIFKCKYPVKEKSETEEIIPILYKSLYKEEMAPAHREENVMTGKDRRPLPSYKSGEQELPKGLIRYALSDRSFIDKGWTMLPTEKVVRKMNVYRMRPAHPEFDWFNRNKNKRLMLYDTGEKLAEFDDNGRGRWFYRNGRLALDYYDAEEMNAQQRFVIYGSGEPDERGRCHPVTILATFDYLGNGVVFDHTGKIRLKYNQTEGVVLDRSIGPVSHWKWHTLNDPPVLQQVMIDTQMAHKDPEILKLGGPTDNKVRPDNEEMLAIEFDNFIKEKSKKLSQKFKPFQIRTKALKINETFSLKVLDQANVYLIFRDGTTNIKMNIGMILDHQEIVDTDTAEVGEVSNNLERFPARTDSLAGLQRSVAHAQRVERLRLERERRLRHPEPCSSADRLVSAASRPLKPKLQTVPSCSTVTNDACYCFSRKPCTRNVYYDTRFV